MTFPSEMRRAGRRMSPRYPQMEKGSQMTRQMAAAVSEM